MIVQTWNGSSGQHVVNPWPQSVGLNRQVCLGGRAIRGSQRPATGGLNLMGVLYGFG